MNAAPLRLPDLTPLPGHDLRELAVTATRALTAAAPNLEALWGAVAEGRFRLIECFDRCGWRYYVLYENLDASERLARLNARERIVAEAVGIGESEKGVAFALGVTPSAVSAMLKSTMLKLGLRSKFDLVHLVGALRAPRRPSRGVVSLRTSTPPAA